MWKIKSFFYLKSGKSFSLLLKARNAQVTFAEINNIFFKANTKTSGKVESKTGAAKSTNGGTSKVSSAKPEAGGGVPLSVSEFDFTKPPPSLHSNYR